MRTAAYPPVAIDETARTPRPRGHAHRGAVLLAIVLVPATTGSAGATSPRVGTPSAPPAAAPIVAIQPLGRVDPELVHAVAAGVGRAFAVSVVVLPARVLPEAAFYRPRRRYRGERILGYLEAISPARVTKILGLMSEDLSVTKGQVYDWGVMGVAGLACRAGVVSVHRLCRHGAGPGPVARRVRQVAVHELGHTFGVPHCRAPRCIMNDAQGGIRSVDTSNGSFCPACRRRLHGLLR